MTDSSSTPEHRTAQVESAGPYREAEGFKNALTSLRSLTSGEDSRPAMRSAVQLIRHLAWRSPDDSVSWYERTPQNVMDYADFLAVGTGTLIREAMEVALKHAEAATTDGQAESLEALAGIIRLHGADPDSSDNRHPGASPGHAPSPPRERTEQEEMGTNKGEKGDGEDAPTPRGLHHRIHPYMDSLTQYANEDLGEDVEPWIVRDRSTALRNERRGRGRAVVRVWTPGAWAYVTDEPNAGDG